MARPLLTRTLPLLLVTLAAMVRPALAAGEPQIYKSSIRINTWRFERYFPTPTAKEPVYLTTSWYPRFEFTVEGPLPGGTQISVAFKKPDGSAWLNLPCNTPELAAGETAKIVSPDYMDKERQAILSTGVFSFAINLKNELAQKNEVLYSGKFKVGKFHFGNAEPKFKNQFEYFVDHDWTLPIGHLYFDEHIDEEAPRLRVVMWFRGELSTEKLAGYVFYQGKQICSTKISDQGGLVENSLVSTPGILPDPRWERWQFDFNAVCQTNKMTSANKYPAHFHFLDKHPGEYEVKILRDGKLARVATFTVGPDGKIVDNGLATKNKMGGDWMLLPVKVMPGTDGKANTATYQADAFYGNGLAGFPGQ